ncbi:MAG: ATP-binding protein [Longimicrobiaceae bacterium]
MTNYTDGDLEAMLGDIESDIAERKESFAGDAPTKVREAVCAFANDLPDHRVAGVIFIGARDRTGMPSGLAITDELLRQLADIKTDGNIVPPPTITVAKRNLRGAEIAVITVEPSDSPPVRYRGRVHIRVGPRRDIATAQDERILNEKRRARDKPFDVQSMPSATITDLDRTRFESEYLPAAVAPDVLAANERTLEQKLAVTKMVASAENPIPTVLGLLVLGKETRDYIAGAYVQFLRIEGVDLADPIVDEQLIDGPLADVLRRIDDKLESHNRTAVDITGGSRESRRSDYPLSALQQLIRNAVMHRTYEASNMPVRVTWYDDRIEITNPGGPFGAVSIENFGQPGVADYRNPNLAEAMRVLGFVQRFGAGLAIARRELALNGNPPPQFLVHSSHLGVIVKGAE